MGEFNGVEIFLGYLCNIKCKFCFQKDLRESQPIFLDYNDVIEIINKAVISGKKSIIFSGGESTLDTNLLEYIKYCKKKGFDDIRVHSNGLMFSNKDILDKYINNGMTGTIISIHGYSKIHDYLVGNKFAFEKVKKALLYLTDVKNNNPKFVIDTNTVLNKYNYKSLYKLFKFLSYFPITRSQIVQLYSLYLFDKTEKKDLYVSYNEFSKELRKFGDFYKNITLENIPYCKINKKYWGLITKRQKYNNQAFGNMGEGFDESDCTYLDTCKNCDKYKDCVGIPKDYIEVFPQEKFIL